MERTSFVTENGIILDVNGKVMAKIPGHPSHVNFPEETILKIHKMSPGVIDRLVHTHPLGMFQISSTDKILLKSLAMVMHPFPIRLSTLTTDNDWDIIESIYVARLEPKECWLERKQHNEFLKTRNIEIELEQEITYYPGDIELRDNNHWVKELFNSSFNRIPYKEFKNEQR